MISLSKNPFILSSAKNIYDFLKNNADKKSTEKLTNFEKVAAQKHIIKSYEKSGDKKWPLLFLKKN